MKSETGEENASWSQGGWSSLLSATNPLDIGLMSLHVFVCALVLCG